MIIYNFFKYIYLHTKYSKLLNKVYKDENLLENLSKLFNRQFKRDWVGRIYTVINPYVENDKYKDSSVIFEQTTDGFDNKTYVEQFIMEKLLIADRFIHANNLFDLLTYNIKKIDNYGNYLFIMKPITYDDTVKYIKQFFILLGILSLIGIGIIIYLNLN